MSTLIHFQSWFFPIPHADVILRTVADAWQGLLYGRRASRVPVQRQRLSSLDDRLLSDIGLARAAVTTTTEHIQRARDRALLGLAQS